MRKGLIGIVVLAVLVIMFGGCVVGLLCIAHTENVSSFWTSSTAQSLKGGSRRTGSIFTSGIRTSPGSRGTNSQTSSTRCRTLSTARLARTGGRTTCS